MTRKIRIEQLLIEHMTPVFLSVENESSHHHVPEGSETHFKVTVVSSLFNDKNRINRHRMVNQLLKEEFNLGLHALSMHLYTEAEWETREGSILGSPSCKDGYKNG